MYDVRLVGTKANVLAHFKDKMKGLKEQSEESWAALQSAVEGLLPHMPDKSPVYSGVMVHIQGDVRPEQGRILIVVESVTLAGV